MNNNLCYAIVEVASLPDLKDFQTKHPRILSDGRAIIKWAGDCPVDAKIGGFEQNRFQTGIVYWLIEKRYWYTHSEILNLLESEEIPMLLK